MRRTNSPAELLPMRVLLVHKSASHDPALQALIRWIPRLAASVQFFFFTDDERGKRTVDTSSPHPGLCAAIAKFSPTHVLVWVPLLNEAEIDFCHARGVKVAALLNSFVSLSSGLIRDQRRFLQVLAKYEAYFVTHEPHVQVLRDHGVRALPMPFFYDPEVYYPRSALWRRCQFREYPVLFIGSLMERGAENRAELVAELARHFPVYVVTYQRPNIPGVRWLGVANRASQINRLMNRSAVVLGSDRIPQQQQDAYNARIENPVVLYDMKFALRGRIGPTFGSGACYTVERHSEMLRYFTEDDALMWDHLAEAVEKIGAVLSDRRQRDRIAGNAWAKVRIRDTAEVRTREILTQLQS